MAEHNNNNKQVNNAETKCTRHTDCSHANKGYCDKTSKTCKPCQANCIACQSADLCNSCEPTTHVTTIAGECTPKCVSLKNNEFCDNGTAKSCTNDATSPCHCTNNINCGTCETGIMPKCATCLTGMKLDDNSRCADCMTGYIKITARCWLVGTDPNIPVNPMDPVDPEVPTSNKLGGGAITGIVIGAVVVVGAVAGGLAYYFIKRGKK
uniref:Cysteine-rich membrane protein 1 n=1 Tax=Spironucleus salmonicida TaxID=348837 RepID=V6LW51_9EUKA|eukprot:EST48478.1 Cysteine-rich membrane protein 1 [Spironucleus salmonicida]